MFLDCWSGHAHASLRTCSYSDHDEEKGGGDGDFHLRGNCEASNRPVGQDLGTHTMHATNDTMIHITLLNDTLAFFSAVGVLGANRDPRNGNPTFLSPNTTSMCKIAGDKGGVPRAQSSMLFEPFRKAHAEPLDVLAVMACQIHL